MTDIVVIALSLGLEKNHMMRCYGDMVVNPTGGAVRMNFGFAPLVAYAEAFRFKTELNGYKLWVYVNGRVVTHVEYVFPARIILRILTLRRIRCMCRAVCRG